MAKLKCYVAAALAVVLLGAGGLAYRAAGQAQPAGPAAPQPAGAGRPLTELEILRREVEVLKLQVEVLQAKVRSLEQERHALNLKAPAADEVKPLYDRAPGRSAGPDKVGQPPIVPDAPMAEIAFVRDPLRNREVTPLDLTRDAEAALKALREAKDDQERRRAADQLGRALQALREQLKQAQPQRPAPK